MKTHNWNWKDLGLASTVLLLIVATFTQQAASPLQHFVLGIATGLLIGVSIVYLASAPWKQQDH